MNIPKGKLLGTLCLKKHEHEGTKKTLRNKSGSCVVCQKERAAGFYKKNKSKMDAMSSQWSRDNREKVRAFQKKYADSHPETKKNYYKANKDYYRAYGFKYRAKNKKKIKGRHAKYYAENSEKIKAKVKEYKDKQPVPKRHCCKCGIKVGPRKFYCEKCFLLSEKEKKPERRLRSIGSTRRLTRRNIDELTDGYIAGLLGLPVEASKENKELFEAKRVFIKIRRFIKKGNENGDRHNETNQDSCNNGRAEGRAFESLCGTEKRRD